MSGGLSRGRANPRSLTAPVDSGLGLAQALPAQLAPRVRAWILAQAPLRTPELWVDEICNAMTSRRPTGDDLALLDRAIASPSAADHARRWETALGKAPHISELGAALSSYAIPDHWRRALMWASLLPSDSRGQWTPLVEIFVPLHGSPRQHLQRRDGVKAGSVGAPIEAAALLAVEPEEAARIIANWRPAPGEWPTQRHLLAQTLQSVVEQDPGRWLAAPLRIVNTLQHPLYIGAYLEAANTLSPRMDLPIGRLLQVAELVRSHPWDIPEAAADSADEPDDWRYPETVSIRLVQKLARAGHTFTGNADKVWDLIEDESASCPPRPDLAADRRDVYTSAINRSCTQALPRRRTVAVAQRAPGLRRSHTDGCPSARRKPAADRRRRS